MQNLYKQAVNTYKAIHGTEPEHLPYKDASHAPFRGIDPEIVKELVDERKVSKFLREWKKENKPEEIDFSQPSNDFVPFKSRRRPSSICLPDESYHAHVRTIDLLGYHEKVSDPDYNEDFNTVAELTSYEKASSLRSRIFLPSEKDLVDHYFYPKKGVMEIFKKDYHKNHFKHIEQPTLFYRGKGILSMQYQSIDSRQPFENGIVKIWFSYHFKYCLIGEISTDAKSTI
jgi:hypothetical protein